VATVIRNLLSVLLLFSTSGCAVFRPAPPARPDYDRYTSSEHSDFGVVYEEAGDDRAAEQQYEQAIRKDASNHVAWTNLGNHQVQAGRPESAREAYRKALSLRPGYGPAVHNLAVTYLDTPPPEPARAIEVINAHLSLVDDETKVVLEEVLSRAKGME
jgi:Tfp pilus assembly protein PilF